MSRNHRFSSAVSLAWIVVAMAAHTQARADVFGSGTNSFSLDFVAVGDIGNANSTTYPYGAVPYEYRMGTYEISQSNVDKAKAGGLTNVVSGTWTGNRPAGEMNWYEAAAFVNWLNTSSGYQQAYDLSWNGSAWSMSLWTGTNAWTTGGTNSFRNKNAVYFLPSENEWFKAAYYNPSGTNYYSWPTSSNSTPTNIAGGTAAGTAVYGGIPGGPAAINNAGGLSPYGTMAQGGNVSEWLETAFDGVNSDPSESRATRGGSYSQPNNNLFYAARTSQLTTADSVQLGFRVVAVPEPASLALIATGTLAAGGGWRLRRRKRGAGSRPTPAAPSTARPNVKECTLLKGLLR